VTQIAVVYFSSSGRTKALAEGVGRGAASVAGTVPHVLSIDHDAGRTQAVLAASDAIVFGCPTYMGSVPAQFKAFMDGTSAVWALQGWRDKLAAGFTHSAAPSGDKMATLLQLAVFAAQHGMIWVGLGLPPTYVSEGEPSDSTNRLGSHLGAMAQSRPGGGELPAGDVRTAELLGQRVAELAKRLRAGRATSTSAEGAPRHPTARAWELPPEARPPLGGGVERTNLRELASRPERFEHHLMVAATVDGARLEVTTASEPLYFAHINVSDEYAIALPTGDELVDRFPLRTFLTDPETGEDVGRYNHRIGDLVLHPQGLLHWPGRLRPPYEPFDFPPGMRRCGLSIVYCASEPAAPSWCPLPFPANREGDAKAYATPAPPMVLASLRGQAGVLAKVGRTELSLLELPKKIAPPRGGWVVVLEGAPQSEHFSGDLLRIAEGASLDGRGIVRALLLASEHAAVDPAPPLWRVPPVPPFSPFEEGEPGELPLEAHGLRAEATSNTTVAIALDGAETEVPRYWLARMLFRVALHGMRLGYVETYGAFFVDDRGDDVRFGIRRPAPEGPAFVEVKRRDAVVLVESLYRAAAPPGYRERPT
jgi:NAD(P)H dehydrogenase (quinone)